MAETKCTNIGLYESLIYCKGETLLPGVRPRVFSIAKRNIVTWPTLPKVGDVEITKANELASYKGNFVLASDKKWVEIDVLDNTGEITWETQGDKPCRTFLNKFPIHHPRIDESAAAFQRQALSDDMVYLVQQRNGQFRVLGNEMFETDTKPKGSSGKEATSAGDMGSQFEIEVTDVAPAPFYPGEIETADGKISGADGSVIE